MPQPLSDPSSNNTMESSGPTCVFVGGTDETVSERDLFNLFSVFGNVASVTRIPARHCSFIEYQTPQEAVYCVSQTQKGIAVGVSKAFDACLYCFRIRFYLLYLHTHT